MSIKHTSVASFATSRELNMKMYVAPYRVDVFNVPRACDLL